MLHHSITRNFFALGLFLTSTSILQATQKEEYTLPNGYYHIILTNTSYSNHLLAFDQQEEENNTKEKIKNLVIYVHTPGETHNPKRKHVSFYLEQEKSNHNTKAPTYTLRLDKDNTNSYALFYTQENKLVLSQKNRSSFLLQEMDKKHNNLTNLNPLLYEDKKNTYLLKLIDKKSKKEILGNGFVPQSIKNNSLVTTIQSPCILSLADYNQLPQKINLPSVQHHRQLSSTNQQPKKLTIEDMVMPTKLTNLDTRYRYVLIWDKTETSTSVIGMNKKTQQLQSWTQSLQGPSKPPKSYVNFQLEESDNVSGNYILRANADCSYVLTKDKRTGALDFKYEYDEDDEDDNNAPLLPQEQLFSFRKVKKDYTHTRFTHLDFPQNSKDKYKRATHIVLYDPKDKPVNIKDLVPNNEDTQNNTSTISLLSSFSLLLYNLQTQKSPNFISICKESPHPNTRQN